MKSKTLPLLLLLSFQSFAQDSSFRLKDYKYRTPGFKALALDLNLSGSTTRSDIINESENTSFQLAPSQIRFTKIVSTDKRLHQSTFTLLPWVNISKTKENNEEIQHNRIQASFQWERSDRFYKSKLHFIEVGNLLDASVENASLERSNTNFKNNILQLQNTFNIGFGRGRIERVQDAQMALFILNDLKSQGLLNGDVTAAQVNSFAQLITDINNKRVFDFRRRRIFELTRIDSFLQNSGLVQKTDIRHFTTVNDNWAFAVNSYRHSGMAWFVRLKPSIGYSRSGFNEKLTAGGISKGNNDAFPLSVEPEIGIEKYIPTSLKWQQNMGITLSYKFSRSNSTIKNNSSSNPSTPVFEFDIHHRVARFTGFYGIGFFPNNRTQISLDLLSNVCYDIAASNSYKERSWTLSPELNFYANYFIGYRTYLNATAYFRYDYSRYEQIFDKYRNLNASINLGFSHILF